MWVGITQLSGAQIIQKGGGRLNAVHVFEQNTLGLGLILLMLLALRASDSAWNYTMDSPALRPLNFPGCPAYTGNILGLLSFHYDMSQLLIYTYTMVSLSLYKYTHTHIYMYIYIYTYTCICLYTHIHVYI